MALAEEFEVLLEVDDRRGPLGLLLRHCQQIRRLGPGGEERLASEAPGRSRHRRPRSGLGPTSLRVVSVKMHSSRGILRAVSSSRFRATSASSLRPAITAALSGGLAGRSPRLDPLADLAEIRGRLDPFAGAVGRRANLDPASGGKFRKQFVGSLLGVVKPGSLVGALVLHARARVEYEHGNDGPLGAETEVLLEQPGPGDGEDQAGDEHHAEEEKQEMVAQSQASLYPRAAWRPGSGMPGTEASAASGRIMTMQCDRNAGRDQRAEDAREQRKLMPLSYSSRPVDERRGLSPSNRQTIRGTCSAGINPAARQSRRSRRRRARSRRSGGRRDLRRGHALAATPWRGDRWCRHRGRRYSSSVPRSSSSGSSAATPPSARPATASRSELLEFPGSHVAFLGAGREVDAQDRRVPGSAS